MVTARIAKELVFKTPTRVGLLADVAEALASAGVNITAIGAYDKDGMGEFLLVTSDEATAAATLAGLGGDVTETEVVVVVVDNEPGALASVARRVADAGINISQVHATTSGGAQAMVVLRSDEDARIVELLAGI